MNSDISKRKMFDPHLSFFDLPMVRGTVTVCVLAICIVFGVIFWNSSLAWDLSYEGFNHFLRFLNFRYTELDFSLLCWRSMQRIIGQSKVERE